MLFSQVSLPDVARISRRTVFGSLAVGIVGLVICVVLQATFVGLGLCLGIGLGIGNFRMVQGSVAKVGRRSGSHRRPLAMNTVGRLAVITAVALGCLFLNFDLGFGVMAGLAVFQFLLLFGVVRSMLKGAGASSFGGGSLFSGLSGMLSVDSVDDAGAPESRPAIEAPDDDRGDE
jgi:hypothetical protein